MKSTVTAVGLFGLVIAISFSSQYVSGAEPNPKTTLQQARTDVRGHRLSDALTAYEKVIADSSHDAAKYKADALYELLLLRVSPDPAVHDLPRGAAAIESLRAYPTYPRASEIEALGALLQEVDRHVVEEKRVIEESRLAAQRLAEATTKLTAADGRVNELSAQLTAAKQMDESGKLRQDATGLRAENRNLRDQLAKAQAELQKRDEALKKVADSVMKRR
jgi:hypothetical protein